MGVESGLGKGLGKDFGSQVEFGGLIAVVRSRVMEIKVACGVEKMEVLDKLCQDMLELSSGGVGAKRHELVEAALMARAVEGGLGEDSLGVANSKNLQEIGVDWNNGPVGVGLADEVEKKCFVKADLRMYMRTVSEHYLVENEAQVQLGELITSYVLDVGRVAQPWLKQDNNDLDTEEIPVVGGLREGSSGRQEERCNVVSVGNSGVETEQIPRGWQAEAEHAKETVISGRRLLEMFEKGVGEECVDTMSIEEIDRLDGEVCGLYGRVLQGAKKRSTGEHQRVLQQTEVMGVVLKTLKKRRKQVMAELYSQSLSSV